MHNQPIGLVDQNSTKIAALHVEPNGDRFRGTICLDKTPPELKDLFEEFEEYVEGQMFTLADEIEEKIGMYPLKVIFPDGLEDYVKDLQVFPSTKRVSFKLRHACTAAR